MGWFAKLKERLTPKQCRSTSGMIGWRCDLPYGHDGMHEALIGTTTTNGIETGRKMASWS